MKKRTEDSILKEKIEKSGGQFIKTKSEPIPGKRNGQDIIRYRAFVQYYCKCQLNKPEDERIIDIKVTTSIMSKNIICCIKCSRENVKKTNLEKYGTEYYTDILNKDPNNGTRVSEGIKTHIDKEPVIGPRVKESDEKNIDYDEDIMEHLEELARQRRQTCVDYCLCLSPNSNRIDYYVAIICNHTKDKDDPIYIPYNNFINGELGCVQCGPSPGYKDTKRRPPATEAEVKNKIEVIPGCTYVKWEYKLVRGKKLKVCFSKCIHNQDTDDFNEVPVKDLMYSGQNGCKKCAREKQSKSMSNTEHIKEIDNFENAEIQKEAEKRGIIITEIYKKDTHRYVKFNCPHGLVDMCAKTFKQGSTFCKACNVITREQTCIEKYGVKNPMNLSEFVEKSMNTLCERNGGIHPFKEGKYKTLAQKAFYNIYGCNSNFSRPDVRENTLKNHHKGPRKWTDKQINQIAETKGCKIVNIDRSTGKIKITIICKCQLGKNNPICHTTTMCHFKHNTSLCKKCASSRIHATMLLKYGTTYTLAIPGVARKHKLTSYSYKEFIRKNGDVIKCRGYEHFAYKLLYERGYTDDNIIPENILIDNGVMPKFTYIDKTCNKKRRYYPDIFIKSENKFIEVKSTYTLILDKLCIDDKLQSVVDSGYNIELWIISSKGRLLEVTKKQC